MKSSTDMGLKLRKPTRRRTSSQSMRITWNFQAVSHLLSSPVLSSPIWTLTDSCCPWSCPPSPAAPCRQDHLYISTPPVLMYTTNHLYSSYHLYSCTQPTTCTPVATCTPWSCCTAWQSAQPWVPSQPGVELWLPECGGVLALGLLSLYATVRL